MDPTSNWNHKHRKVGPVNSLRLHYRSPQVKDGTAGEGGGDSPTGQSQWRNSDLYSDGSVPYLILIPGICKKPRLGWSNSLVSKVLALQA